MSVEGELKDLLKALGYPVVWGVFGKGVGFPRITLQRIATVTKYSLTGRADVETARVQVNIASETYGELISLVPLVSHTLTEFRGRSVIRCTELSRRDGSSETGGDIIRQQLLDISVRYRA
ncbi:DUF3168 domain-containing protein [Phaeobacter inhibens]|uniref:DUF3168 domain-containing protein n=1 Tax=Phaeobacter inhibens TaxID=221822 RepID=A0A2I7K673_9RHOB|nr:DUF3168 domain-containing protein [Phaeobacter inhibens]AUQ98101.1 hypothetical protein PhaeoP88_00705 [Phaeobacter inhibens]